MKRVTNTGNGDPVLHAPLLRRAATQRQNAKNTKKNKKKKENRPLVIRQQNNVIETTGMSWVEQAALRGAMAMGISLSREQIYEMGHEGDALDSAKFKQLIKSSRPWYMSFVQKNDAKGLTEWLKRAVNVLAANKLVVQGVGVLEHTGGRVVGADDRTGICAACSPCSRTCRLTTQSCGAR